TSPSTVTLASVTRWMTARIRSFWHAHPRPHRPPKCDVVGQENPYCDVERHSRSRAGEHLPHLGPESSADLVRESSAVNHESTYAHVRKSLCRNPPGSAMLNEDRCCDGTCRASRRTRMSPAWPTPGGVLGRCRAEPWATPTRPGCRTDSPGRHRTDDRGA